MNPETGSLRQHRLAAIIVAAGRGERAGGALPKQYHLVGGLSVLARSLIALGNPAISRLVCVISPDADALYETALSDLPARDRRALDALGSWWCDAAGVCSCWP